MKRRELLVGATVGSAALSGCASLPEVGSLGSPEKGEKLGERTYRNALISAIELYEGGYADVTLQEEHNMERIGISHDSQNMGPATEPISEAYETWSLPEFSGPKSYQISQPIMNNNDNYPSNVFKLRVAPEEGTVAFTITRREEVSFPVPESFVPDGTPIEQEL